MYPHGERQIGEAPTSIGMPTPGGIGFAPAAPASTIMASWIVPLKTSSRPVPSSRLSPPGSTITLCTSLSQPLLEDGNPGKRPAPSFQSRRWLRFGGKGRTPAAAGCDVHGYATGSTQPHADSAGQGSPTATRNWGHRKAPRCAECQASCEEPCPLAPASGLRGAIGTLMAVKFASGPVEEDSIADEHTAVVTEDGTVLEAETDAGIAQELETAPGAKVSLNACAELPGTLTSSSIGTGPEHTSPAPAAGAPRIARADEPGIVTWPSELNLALVEDSPLVLGETLDGSSPALTSFLLSAARRGSTDAAATSAERAAAAAPTAAAETSCPCGGGSMGGAAKARISRLDTPTTPPSRNEGGHLEAEIDRNGDGARSGTGNRWNGRNPVEAVTGVGIGSTCGGADDCDGGTSSFPLPAPGNPVPDDVEPLPRGSGEDGVADIAEDDSVGASRSDDRHSSNATAAIVAKDPFCRGGCCSLGGPRNAYPGGG